MPFVALLLALLAQSPLSPSGPSAGGVVVDATGAPVPGARIEAGSDPSCAVVTSADGTYLLPCAEEAAEIRVTAPGFRTQVASGARRDRIVLQAAVHTEMVLVTASRSDRWATSRAAPVSVLTAEQLAHAPPVPLDDALRTVPGFSLFRRTSSRVANPTTQGATLRGLSASGASRALVLADGLALNDPFGGWVSWTRIPQASIERVEVLRGGASDLYGADALAGVVQVLTMRPEGPTLRGEISAASRRTARTSVFAGTRRDRWDLSGSAEAFTTRGYVLVPEDERGAVDVEAGGRYATVRAGVGRSWDRWYLRAGGHGFLEDRENGTVLQTNDTAARQVRFDGGGDGAWGRSRITVHAAAQTYRQTFSAIATDRSRETLTLRQRVPAEERGATGEWSRPFARMDLLAGADLRQTTATNHEQGYAPDGQPRTPAATDAFQRTSGAFAQATVRPSGGVTLTAGVRGDLRERDRAGGLGGADGHVSPRAAAAWTVTPAVVVRGSLGWSFRAPTLNERFRGFRVGSVETRPNPLLAPERLRTVEGGLFYAPRGASLRATVFRSDLHDAIANLTVSSTPALIVRRRANVGGIRVWGAELEGDWRLGTRAALTGSAALLDSRFVADPQLSGNRVPQVPAWQLAAGFRWEALAGTTAAFQVRAFGDQYEDDRNTLTLRRGAVVDATLTHTLPRGASLFAAVENLFNVRYDAGRTPARTLGQPFSLHAGVRFTMAPRRAAQRAGRR